MKKFFYWLPLWSILLGAFSVQAQNINIAGSCTQALSALVPGADPLLATLNGRPVYYNAAVPVNYASSNINTEAHLYYELAANLGTPEDRWVISFDGQPFYYFISASLTAPGGTYLPFDPMEPVSMCGGSINATPAFPLDVDLLSFQAKAEAQQNVIFWTTATETNNHFFEVERSSDALNFEVLGRVYSRADQGNSRSQIAYSWADQQPLRNRAYYRLTQTDLDGHRQVASAVVELVRENGSTVSAYPNPVQDILTIQAQAAQDEVLSYEVKNLTGQIVASGKLLPSNRFEINFSGLPNGFYVVQLNGEQTDVQVFKIRKH